MVGSLPSSSILPAAFRFQGLCTSHSFCLELFLAPSLLVLFQLFTSQAMDHVLQKPGPVLVPGKAWGAQSGGANHWHAQTHRACYK